MAKSRNAKTVAREDRLQRYKELRDDDVDSYDAARAIGISIGGTREAYERWYRKTIGLPDREKGRPRHYD